MTSKEKEIKEGMENINKITALQSLKTIEQHSDIYVKYLTYSGQTICEVRDIKFYTSKIERALKKLEVLSKYINYKLYEQDSCYFIQVGNEPLKSITKEEYDILKRWKDGSIN